MGILIIKQEMQVAKRGFFKGERMFGLQICNIKRNEIINFKIKVMIGHNL